MLLPPILSGCGGNCRLTQQADPIAAPSLCDSVPPCVGLPWLVADLWASGRTIGIAAWVVGEDVLALVGATRAGLRASHPHTVGWYLRVRLDLDVVFGDEALGAIQLSLVPVLVIFHVEDLRWERSREVSAQPSSPWERGRVGPPLLPQTSRPPPKPGEKGALTKVTWFGGVWGYLYRAGCSPQPSSPHGRSGSPRVPAAGGVSGVAPNPRPGKRVKSVPGGAGVAARPPHPPRAVAAGCSVGGSTPVRAGVLTPASARHHFPASHAGARGPAQLCKQDPKPWGTALGPWGKHAAEAGTGTAGSGPWVTAGPCPRPPGAGCTRGRLLGVGGPGGAAGISASAPQRRASG